MKFAVTRPPRPWAAERDHSRTALCAPPGGTPWRAFDGAFPGDKKKSGLFPVRPAQMVGRQMDALFGSHWD